MKQLKFKGFKTQWILDGTKTASVRLFDDKNLKAGDELELINSDDSKVFAHAVVTDVPVKTLGEITDADLGGHEKYESREAMLESFKKFYGDKVDLGTEAKIVRFRLKEN